VVDYRLLGPLEVWDGDAPLNLGGAKQRALLALLLLNSNRVLPTERLIEELWGETPPDTAANAVQVYVANLRKILQPGRLPGAASDVIVTRAPGYLIRVMSDDVDLMHFERLTADARRALTSDPETASTLLRQALALWRGPALADVVFEGPARGDITRLEELHLSALEDRIQADLDLGRHAALVGELTGLVAAHSVRERLHAQLMLALYRSGRQAEALKAYRDARTMLVEELGIDPSPELQSLEKAILQQDPALLLAPRAEPARPPEPPARVAEERIAASTTVVEPAAAAAPPPPPPPPELPPQPAIPAPPVAAATTPPSATKPGPPRRGRWLLAAGAGLLVLGSFGGVVLHQRSTGGPAAVNPPTTGPGPSASPSSTPTGAAFPTAAERSLIALFPQGLVDTQACHRYAKHYPLAIAEVECPTSKAHPEAASVVYQQFDSYKQLEVHYHHVLALDIQSEVGPSKPLTSAASTRCSPGAGFFSATKFHVTGQLPDPASSPNAEGHLFCYDGSNGVPKLAWTNNNWLVVAQAAGVGTGPDAEANLLNFWQFAGPAGQFTAPASATTPEAEVRYLYERYLGREPENPALNTAHYAAEIQARGFADVANEFARSQEASALVGGATKVLH
jgi:DNA-binding SARP family transcriptional activator